MNYIDLFNLVLAKEQPLKIELPDQWLWDIIEEFIYQFQSFCNFRTKLAKRSDDDIEQLKRNIKIWNVHAVLNVMHSLVDKSRIVEQLEASKKGGKELIIISLNKIFIYFIVAFNPSGDLFCQTNLYKMFGYFSLIGLLKLHTLTSDYYMALKTIECIDLDVTKQVNIYPII
jgi:translation initiation factor 3 subunit L